MYQLKKVAHAGCVNRIRSMTQKPHICATWGDTGHVQVIQFLPQISFSFYVIVGCLNLYIYLVHHFSFSSCLVKEWILYALFYFLIENLCPETECTMLCALLTVL
jgi:hypothetical protein